MHAVAPNGKRIVGTLETMKGCAIIQDGSWEKVKSIKKAQENDGGAHCEPVYFRSDMSATGEKDGPGVTFEYDGETEVWWDDQKTEKTADGRKLFLDEGMDTWTISDIKLVED